MAIDQVLGQIIRRLTDLERRMQPRESSNSCCILENKGTQTIAHNTVTAIEFPTEIRDLDNLHSMAVNTSRITVKVGGVYLATGGLRIAADAVGRRIVRIAVNGTTVAPAHEHPAINEANQIGTTVKAVCSAGDYLELTFQQTSGGDLDIDTARFAATRIA